MKKIGLLCLAMVLALGSMGVAFSQWTETLTIEGTSATGQLAGGFIVDECTDSETPPPDVGKCEWELIDTNGDSFNDMLNITMSNAYPCYQCTCNFTIENQGTIPYHIDEVKLDNPNPGEVNVSLSGDITGDVCTVLKPGEKVTGTITAHVLEGAAENSTYTFTATIHVIQWNTYNPTLTTSASPSAGGSTTGDGSYTYGTLAPITATTNPGYAFTGWTGMGITDPLSASTTVLMNTTKTVTANFAKETYTLATSVSPPGVGTVTGGGSHEYCTNVTVTANSTDPCYYFDYWSGNLSGSTNPEIIHMDGNKSVTAHFAKYQYTLTTNSVGNGSVSGGGTHDCCTNVTVNATPAPGWEFDHWSGNLSGSTNPESIHIDGNKNVTAHFKSAAAPVTVCLNPDYGYDTTDGAYNLTETDLAKLASSDDSRYRSYSDWPGWDYSDADYIEFQFPGIPSGATNVSAELKFEWQRTRWIDEGRLRVWENSTEHTHYLTPLPPENTDRVDNITLGYIDTAAEVNNLKIWFQSYDKLGGDYTRHDLVELCVTYTP